METLLELERDGWRALSHGTAAAFYDVYLTEDALMVLPGIGAIGRAAIIQSMASAPPWASFAIEEPRVAILDATNAVLVYRARAQRADQPEYRAFMSTAYTYRAEGWRIAFHQQTVIETQ
jgi:hypothetical protein